MKPEGPTWPCVVREALTYASGAKYALRDGQRVLLEENADQTIGYVWDEHGMELIYTFREPEAGQRYLAWEQPD